MAINPPIVPTARQSAAFAGWTLTEVHLFPGQSFNGTRTLARVAVDYTPGPGESAKVARGRYIEDQYGERGFSWDRECLGVVPWPVSCDIERELAGVLAREGRA